MGFKKKKNAKGKIKRNVKGKEGEENGKCKIQGSKYTEEKVGESEENGIRVLSHQKIRKTETKLEIDK